jgi:hypothetical protein
MRPTPDRCRTRGQGRTPTLSRSDRWGFPEECTPFHVRRLRREDQRTDAASLAPHAQHLVDDVATLKKDFCHQDFDLNDLPLRTHEILENTLHQELTGAADYGSGTQPFTTEANINRTKELLGLLGPLTHAPPAATSSPRRA